MRAKRSKYGNVSTVVDGVTFHSRKEARRYQELRLLEKAGELHGLSCQPRYPLKVHGALVAHYVGDFAYCTCHQPDCDMPPSCTTIEDVKSEATKTPVYRLKKKLMLAIYGVDIHEV